MVREYKKPESQFLQEKTRVFHPVATIDIYIERGKINIGGVLKPLTEYLKTYEFTTIEEYDQFCADINLTNKTE